MLTGWSPHKIGKLEQLQTFRRIFNEVLHDETNKKAAPGLNFTSAFKSSVFTSHVIKTKNRNYSMNKVKNLGYDR